MIVSKSILTYFALANYTAMIKCETTTQHPPTYINIPTRLPYHLQLPPPYVSGGVKRERPTTPPLLVSPTVSKVGL